MLLDARVGALTLHGGQVLGLEVDDALVSAVQLGTVQEVTQSVELVGLNRSNTFH